MERTCRVAMDANRGIEAGRWTEQEDWRREGEELEWERTVPRSSAEEARERPGNRSVGKRTRVRGGRWRETTS